MIDTLPTGSIYHLASDTGMNADEFAAEVSRRASILTHHLSAERRTVALVHADTPSFFADLFAIWAVGGCAACLNPGMAPEELRTTLSLCNATLVLTDGADYGQFDIPVLRLADEQARDQRSALYSCGPDTPALMLFTSGTTGVPKAVVHSARSLLARVSLNAAHIGCSALARTACALPTHFGHGLIGNCLTALHGGGDLYLARNNNSFAATGLGQAIDDKKITFMSSTPSLWRMALRLSRPPQSTSLQRVHIGSAPLSAKLWNQVMSWTQDAEVVNMYGLTETANWFGGSSSRYLTPEDGLIGIPWGGASAIKTAEGEIVRSGEGEILLRSPSMMLGYHDREDLTAVKFSDGWYLTGDIGSIDETGTARLKGRVDDVINVGGIKVCPEEVDILMERHDAIAEACTFPADDPVAGQVPYTAVRLMDDASALAANELIAWARDRIRLEATPRKIFLVTAIPKTDRGKIRRMDVARAVMSPTGNKQP